jgi:hypothetical protein
VGSEGGGVSFWTEERLQRVVMFLGLEPFRYGRIRDAAEAIRGDRHAASALYSALKRAGRITVVDRDGDFNLYSVKELA